MADEKTHRTFSLSRVNEQKLVIQRHTNISINTPLNSPIKKKKMEETNLSRHLTAPILKTIVKTEMMHKNQIIENEDYRKRLAAWDSSVGLLGHLFTILPNTSLVQESLTRLLLFSDATLRSKVTEHAQRQLRASYDITKPIDWTDLETPAHVCQAVWHFHIMEKLLQQD